MFRAAGAEARLEELPEGEEWPGQGVRAEAFDCAGRLVVALVPAERSADARKLGCPSARVVPLPPFPFRRASVYLERSLLATSTVWIEAGTSHHVVGVSPSQLLQLVRAQTGDFVADD